MDLYCLKTLFGVLTCCSTKDTTGFCVNRSIFLGIFAECHKILGQVDTTDK